MSAGKGLLVNQAEKDILSLLGLLLLTLLVYLPGLSGGYIFDDFGNLVENSALAEQALHAHFWAAVWSSPSSVLHRPLSMFSFAAQMWFTGMDPWPLKLGNVLLHLVNGVLVFLLSRRVLGWLYQRSDTSWLLPPRALTLLVTAAWLLAPIQLTAVLYVIQRMESLATLFVLLGLLAWWHGRMRLIQGRVGAWSWIWGGLVVGTVLATLAKETGVMLPVYAFLLDWLVLGFVGRAGAEDRRLWGVFALVLFLPSLLGLAWLLPSIFYGHAYMSRSFDLSQRLWTEGRVMLDYLHWIVAPTPNVLSLYHDDVRVSSGWLQPWTTVASWGLIATLLVSAWFLRRCAPLYALGVAWFFAGQLLVSTILPLELVYEHRNYLPSWGVFVALFGLLSARGVHDPERRRVMRLIVISAVVGLVTLYAGFTALRAQTWGSPFQLAYFEATTHPDSPRANYALARLMMVTAASVDSPSYGMGEQIMQKVTRLNNAGLQPFQALIFMALKHGQSVDPAIWRGLRRKIQVTPLSAEDIGALYSLINCGINASCHYDPENLRQLRLTLDTALDRYPRRADVVTLSANLAANLTHDYDRAYRLMLRAVALSPNRFQYWKNLMVIQMAAGRLQDAAAVLNRLRELNFLGTRDAEIADLAQQLASRQGAQGSQNREGGS